MTHPVDYFTMREIFLLLTISKYAPEITLCCMVVGKKICEVITNE